MTPEQPPRPSIFLPGILVASIILGVSGPAAAGPRTWTGGHPGLAAPAATMIATDPSNPSVVYAAFDLDLYKSADGGRSWTRLRAFDDYPNDHVLSLFVSPASPSTVFVGLETGLFRSADGGAIWTLALDTAVTSMTAQPSDPSVLYAGSASGFFWRGPDDGAAWNGSVSPGRIGYAIASLLFGDRDDGRLYAAGGYDVLTALDYGYGVDSTLLLSQSADLGASWTDLGGSLPPQDGLYVKDLVAGSSAHELFAAMGRATPDRRLAHSTDGGNTWDPKYLRSLPETVDLERLAVDPEHPGTLFAATTAGIYRTTDGGRTWLPFSPSLAARDVTILVLDGRTLHAGTSLGAFELDLREGAVDVAAGPSGTHLLSWSGDRLSVRTLPDSGDPSETPPEGPFGAWTAVAIADGADGRSRVLWVNGDGRAGLEVVGAQGQVSAFRFARRPDGSAPVDVSIGDGGVAHLLWTDALGSAHLSSVDSSGAMTDGPAYGPYTNWTAVAVADGPGATWVLWRATDGRVSLSLHRALAMETVFRFDASPGWAAEDLAIGSDGRPRLLRVNADGRAEVSTVAADGRLTDAQVHANPGFQPLRIAGGPDGLTRLLFSDADGAANVFLLNPDNSLQSQVGSAAARKTQCSTGCSTATNSRARSRAGRPGTCSTRGAPPWAS